jgi:septum formation protein
MRPSEQRIYLASKSPRRRELLRQLGVEFDLLLLRDHGNRDADVSEHVLPDETPEAYVHRVTFEKAQAALQTVYFRRLPSRPVLTADTCVVLGQRILGKPAGEADAIAMLHSLSGQTHQVLTSVAVCHDGEIQQITQASDVSFATLSDATIRAYCATNEPYDKAGAYGIQGYAASFIEAIAGSYTGIMGLPLFETTQLLKQAGLRLP